VLEVSAPGVVSGEFEVVAEASDVAVITGGEV
jgi:hypothetical protein